MTTFRVGLTSFSRSHDDLGDDFYIFRHVSDDVGLYLAGSINNNSYITRIKVKNLNIPFLTSNLTFTFRSRSSGNKVTICPFRCAFQIVKPEVDSSSNG